MSEKITKPCRIGGVTFQVGVSVDTVIKESQRLYESQLNNPEKPLVEMEELRKLIMGTHVLVPKTPTNSMVLSGQNSCEGFLYHYQVSSVWDEMINVWILTMLVIGYNHAPTSYQLKFDSVQKCTSYSKYISSQYDGISNIVVAKGICVQTQEQKN